MNLTIHPLEHLPLTESAWAAEVLDGFEPLALWAGTQLGASRGAIVALWPDEAAAEKAAAVETSRIRPGQVLRLTEVHHGPAADLPAVMQLTWFDGPRSAEQSAADERSGRRIEKAVADVPGYCGTLVAHGPDRAYSVVVFTDGLPTLERARDRIMSSRLAPDEDPALLSGPDTIEIHTLARTQELPR